MDRSLGVATKSRIVRMNLTSRSRCDPPREPKAIGRPAKPKASLPLELS
jgi:hypothetical protein